MTRLPGYVLPVSAEDPVTSARRAAEALPAEGVLYYALGGGLGHLTRAAAIGRQWRRQRPEPFVVLTNCRLSLPVEVPVLRLSGEPEAGTLAALVRELAAALRPRVLVTDAFPAGVLGELREVLPALPCPKTAILRRLQPRWVKHWDLPTLLPGAYASAVAVEDGALFEDFPAGLPVCDAGPTLIREAGELLSRKAARAALEVEGDQPVLVVAVSGSQPADQGLVRLCVRVGERLGAAVRVVTPYPQGSLPGHHLKHYPLLEWLPGADLLVGPSGYHLFHEATALGLPGVWVPQRRQYDDQFARAEGAVVARSPEELEQQVAALLQSPPQPVPSYPRGATRAAEWLEHQ